MDGDRGFLGDGKSNVTSALTGELRQGILADDESRSALVLAQRNEDRFLTDDESRSALVLAQRNEDRFLMDDEKNMPPAVRCEMTVEIQVAPTPHAPGLVSPCLELLAHFPLATARCLTQARISCSSCCLGRLQ